VRRALIVAIFLLASCGGSPMAPSAGTPPPAAGSLGSGSYVLTITMATSGNSGVSACVSQTISGSPPFVAVAAPTPVHVERTGNSATIVPDDPSATFRMQLQIAGANVSGTASGQYRTSATPIAVTGTSSGSAAVNGVVGQPFTSGSLDGSVSVDGMTCMNNGHTWSLRPN